MIGFYAAGAMSGGGGGWSPADIPGLVAWYDSELSPKTLSGTNVLQWNDISGNGRHASIASSSHATYSSVDQWLSFSGGAYYAPSSSLIGTGNAPFTLFFSYRQQNTTNSYVYGQGESVTNRAALMGSPLGNSLRLSAWGSDLDAPGAFVLDQDFIAVFKYAAPNRTIYTDGAPRASDTYSAANYSSNSPRIGALHTGGATFLGKLRTIVAYSGALSDADREKVEGYLAHRWGTESSLPSGHPYKSAPP